MSKAGGKKKGLSMEEKCDRVSAWFGAHPHPYTLKELLSLLPKSTGVIWQSIEECVQLLVAEERLRQEKVGVHTLFWRFPLTETQTQLLASGPCGAPGGSCAGGAGNARQANTRMGLADRLALLSASQLQRQRESQEAALRAVEERLAARRGDVGEDDVVRGDANRLQSLQQTRMQLVERLQRLAAFNPQLMVSLAAATRLAYDAANRWTDNVFLLEQRIAARTGQSARELRAALRMPEDLDYIEVHELARDYPREAGLLSSVLLEEGPAALTVPAPVLPLTEPHAKHAGHEPQTAPDQHCSDTAHSEGVPAAAGRIDNAAPALAPALSGSKRGRTPASRKARAKQAKLS